MVFGLSRREREAQAEVDGYVETCHTTGRKYNPTTHVAKQCKASDKINRRKR